jgi:sulfur carrier protein ThiS
MSPATIRRRPDCGGGAGKTVSQVIDQLGIPADEVHLVMVNRSTVSVGHILNENDLVGVFPPVGGG